MAIKKTHYDFRTGKGVAIAVRPVIDFANAIWEDVTYDTDNQRMIAIRKGAAGFTRYYTTKFATENVNSFVTKIDGDAHYFVRMEIRPDVDAWVATKILPTDNASSLYLAALDKVTAAVQSIHPAKKVAVKRTIKSVAKAAPAKAAPKKIAPKKIAAKKAPAKVAPVAPIAPDQAAPRVLHTSKNGNYLTVSLPKEALDFLKTHYFGK